MIKTVSLETAKLLKEAGYNESSIEYFYSNTGTNEKPQYGLTNYDTTNYNDKHFNTESYPAPTTDELLEELPDDIITIYKVNYGYQVSCDVHQIEKKIYDKCLPEALAQMWLYLKKSNLLSGRGK